jgi:hypothetical protein
MSVRAHSTVTSCTSVLLPLSSLGRHALLGLSNNGSSTKVQSVEFEGGRVLVVVDQVLPALRWRTEQLGAALHQAPVHL